MVFWMYNKLKIWMLKNLICLLQHQQKQFLIFMIVHLAIVSFIVSSRVSKKTTTISTDVSASSGSILQTSSVVTRTLFFNLLRKNRTWKMNIERVLTLHLFIYISKKSKQFSMALANLNKVISLLLSTNSFTPGYQ